MEKTLVFIDIETTGINPEVSELLEIAAVRCNYAAIHPFSKIHIMVRPEKGIDPEAQKINHITDGMVKHAEGTPSALDDFFKYLRSTDIIVGHNIKEFDRKFLEKEGHKFTQEIIDTLELATELGFKRGERSLKYLAEKFNIKGETAHRADGDCNITRRVYIELMKMRQQKLPL